MGIKEWDGDLLTPKAVAQMLGIVPASVVALSNRGKLPATRDSSNRRLFRRADVVKLMKARGRS